MTSPRPRCRHRRGMTLVELVLGLAITGMVGAAVAAMLAAVSYGVEDGNDVRRTAVQHKVIEARLGGAIRYSRMALACFDYTGADAVSQRYLVLWMNDAVSTTSPNLSELRVLQWDPRASRRRLTSYRVSLASGTTDTAYQLAGGFTFLAKWIEGEATSPPKPAGVTMVGEVWANGVVGTDFRFGHANQTTYTDTQVQQARLATYRVTIGEGNQAAAVCGAAALRNTQ